MKLLYLHGFRSTPKSPKAVAIADYCKTHGLSAPVMPQLPISPKDSIKLCEKLIKEHAIDTVCGSSLGGFYAIHLAEKYHFRCATINPALTPWNELKQASLQTRYNVEEITPSDAIRYLAELKHYETEEVTDLSRYLLLVAMGDEVLNPWQMRAFFKGAQQIIVEGGDHALNDFGGQLHDLMTFLSS
ncbi:esterase [Formosimonas limnophila]|uniref:Esterase n=1 Tax=Formosimonas limnophila TaxID=1384487 RepID=A0A8J3CGE8_9BURK|nr:YqiA/YcfP family alpha/beta fold hydrolase [Formosimonas limnophila]GHA69821.1 esterase [Formosimonas limnophila]